MPTSQSNTPPFKAGDIAYFARWWMRYPKGSQVEILAVFENRNTSTGWAIAWKPRLFRKDGPRIIDSSYFTHDGPPSVYLNKMDP